jgi:hypothetical protein
MFKLLTYPVPPAGSPGDAGQTIRESDALHTLGKAVSLAAIAASILNDHKPAHLEFASRVATLEHCLLDLDGRGAKVPTLAVLHRAQALTIDMLGHACDRFICNQESPGNSDEVQETYRKRLEGPPDWYTDLDLPAETLALVLPFVALVPEVLIHEYSTEHDERSRRTLHLAELATQPSMATGTEETRGPASPASGGGLPAMGLIIGETSAKAFAKELRGAVSDGTIRKFLNEHCGKHGSGPAVTATRVRIACARAKEAGDTRGRAYKILAPYAEHPDIQRAAEKQRDIAKRAAKV